MTRRSFVKAAAITAGASALGIEAAHNLTPSNKAWADNDVQEIRTSCRACIANCGVIATVSNGRVIKLKGDPIDPMSKGRLHARRAFRACRRCITRTAISTP